MDGSVHANVANSNVWSDISLTEAISQAKLSLVSHLRRTFRLDLLGGPNVQTPSSYFFLHTVFLSIVLTGVPGSPLSPGKPLNPGGPSFPGPPGGPGSPLVPSLPDEPGSPCSPGGPGGPGWPRSPMGPVSPDGP